jgi:hypothetical protein
VQLEAMKTPGAAERGPGLGDRGFKILLGAGLDVDLCDFGDHGRPFLESEGPVSTPVPAKEKGAWRRPCNPVPAIAQ